MGALVFFCFMPGSKPPPWIMKPGITRWKITPSKKPSSTYSWKLRAETGASFSNNSTSKLPRLVSKTIDTGLPAPLTFGDALVAGEIAVRGYVSEASRHKRGAHRRTLRRAVCEEQPAARLQVLRCPINKSGQRRESVAAGRERTARFVPQAILGEHRVVFLDIRWVAHQGVEAARAQRLKPVSRAPFDAARHQP